MDNIDIMLSYVPDNYATMSEIDFLNHVGRKMAARVRELEDPQMVLLRRRRPLIHMELMEVLNMEVVMRNELVARGIVTNGNSIAHNLSERIFCDARGVQREHNNKYYDVKLDGKEYQIKSGVLQKKTGIIRGHTKDMQPPYPFDFLAIIEFEIGYKVKRAITIPYSVVNKWATPAVGGYALSLTQTFWREVRPFDDITEEMRRSLQTLNKNC